METEKKARELRETIRVLERKLGMLQESQTICCNVTLAQCHALVEIGRAEKISLNQLAERLSLENSTVSRTVTNLVNRKLTKRVLDSSDRRYVSITLSESGNKLFQEIEGSMNHYYDRIYSVIQIDKRQQVMESLQILLEAMSQEEKHNEQY